MPCRLKSSCTGTGKLRGEWHAPHKALDLVLRVCVVGGGGL